MANSTLETAPSPDPATHFKGFEQTKPPNERLAQIKIFLADEDRDRNLYFEQRLIEIEEYINHLKKHNIDCDAQLLKDVTLKAQVQKEWQQARDKQLPSGCVCPTSIPTVTQTSNRLIDEVTSRRIERQLKRIGMDAQTREDHPPFTVERTGDEPEFNEALQQDAAQNPLEVDEERNLAVVEEKAYRWALEQPEMIPIWLHPQHGIPLSGERSAESTNTPWYRQPGEKKNRPGRAQLPDYLQKREDEINGLLQRENYTPEEFARLEELLALHEPPNVKDWRKKWQILAELKAEGAEEAEEEYFVSRDEWLDTFREAGISIVVEPGLQAPKTTEPGIFHLPGAEILSKEEYNYVLKRQIKLNKALSEFSPSVYHKLETSVKTELVTTLHDFAPEELSNQDPTAFIHGNVQEPIVATWVEWVTDVAETHPTLVLLRPGEIEPTDPGILGIHWEPLEESFDFGPPIAEADRDWEFNALISRVGDPRIELADAEKTRLAEIIIEYTLPEMIKTERDRKEAKTKARAIEGPSITDPSETEVEENPGLLIRLEKMLDDYQVQVQNTENFMDDAEVAEKALELNDTLIGEFYDFYKMIDPSIEKRVKGLSGTRIPDAVDFSSKAQQRGIRRAAIEIGLNLIATNQEQHRPQDRFRILQLPHPYQSPEKEVPLSLPMEAWRRPVEHDAFEYTKKVAEYQQLKDFDYKVAKDQAIHETPGEIAPPANYNGPFVAAQGFDFHEAARDRQERLQQYYSLLSDAQAVSPRPLLQVMLRYTAWALNPPDESPTTEEFSRLDEDDLRLLEELGGMAWDETSEDIDYATVFRQDFRESRRLEEFANEVFHRDILEYLPFWQAPFDPSVIVPEEPSLLCAPDVYDPDVRSQEGISVAELVQLINDRRARIGERSHMWSVEEGIKFLEVMAEHTQIHLNLQPNEEPQVARVPLSGLPENKYVISLASAPSSAGVHYNENGELEVQYDALGTIGSPIVQPNKYEHFIDLATRLGREIRECLQTQSRPLSSWSLEDGVIEQMEATEDVLNTMKQITPAVREVFDDAPELEGASQSLESLALELNNYAPDLAAEAGFDWSENTDNPFPSDGTEIEKQRWQAQRESEYAATLTMKLLEEANQNWESRFPTNENVWDFASPRVESREVIIDGKPVEAVPRQVRYFDMRRWPVSCQPLAAQSKIEESGPVVPEKPVVEEMKDNEDIELERLRKSTREEIEKDALTPKRKVDRHIKGRTPHFPFGETPFQAQYLSYQMEQDLKDVPEFQPRPKTWRDRFLPPDPFSLPRLTEWNSLPAISKTWKPTSVSFAEKHAQLLQYAKQVGPPGFPDPAVHEYYHTQEEIPHVKAWEEKVWMDYERERARRAVEREIGGGKKMENVSREVLEQARFRAGVDERTGLLGDAFGRGRRQKKREGKKKDGEDRRGDGKRKRVPERLDLSGQRKRRRREMRKL